MYKKVFALTITMVMLMMCITAVPSAAETTGEFIKNGSFSQTNADGTPRDWTLRNTTFGTDCELSSDVPEGFGGKSIHLTAGATALRADANNGLLYGLIPGETYTLSFWVKIVSSSSILTQTRCYFYDAKSVSTEVSSSIVNIYEKRDNHNWQKLSMDITAPADFVSALIRLQAMNSEIYVTGVSLEGKRFDESGKTEHIQNGGFETAVEGIPTYWGSYPVDFKANSSLNTSVPENGGTQSLMVKSITGTVSVFPTSNITHVVPGTEYRFSFDAKSVVSGAYNVNATVSMFSDAAATTEIAGTQILYRFGNLMDWRRHSIYFTAHENAQAITVSFTVRAGDQLFLDNVSLLGEKMPSDGGEEETKTELIANGSFETVENELPVKWSFDGAVADAAFKMSAAGAYDGENYINLTVPGSYVTSGMIGVTPNQKYLVTAYVKSTVAGAAQIKVLLSNGAQVTKTFPSTDVVWKKIELTFSSGESDEWARIRLGSVAEDQELSFDLISVTESRNAIVNGGFEEVVSGGSDGWDCIDWSGVLTSDAGADSGANYVSLTTQGKSVSTDAELTGGRVYTVTARVKSTVAGSARLAIDTFGLDNNTVAATAYNKEVDSAQTFVSTGGVWKTIKFNHTMADGAERITLTLSAALDDGGLAFDNVSIVPADNLVSNGDFEGIEALSSTHPSRISAAAARLPYITRQTEDGYPCLKLDYSTATEPIGGLQFKGREGAAYKLTGKIKSSATTGPRVLVYDDETGSVINKSQSISVTSPGKWTDFTVYLTCNKENSSLFFRFISGSQGKYFYMTNLVLSEMESGANFYTAAGEKLDAVCPGKIRTIYKYVSMEAEPESIVLFVGVYRYTPAGVVLTELKMAEGSAHLYNPSSLITAVTVPDDGETYFVKAFCVDNLSDIRPKGKKASLY